MKKIKTVIGVVSGLFFIGMVVVSCIFFSKFRSISNNPTDYAIFGDFYWNMIIAFATSLNTIMFIIITIKIHTLQMDGQKANLFFSIIKDLKQELNNPIKTKYDNVSLGYTKEILTSFKDSYFGNIFFSETAKTVITETENVLRNAINETDSDKKKTLMNTYLANRDKVIVELLKEIRNEK
jgi:hypothetical protein